MKSICIDARMINSSGIGRYLREVLKVVLENFNVVTLIGNENELTEYAVNYSNVRIVKFEYSVYSIISQFLLPFKVQKCDLFWAPHFSSTFFKINCKRRITTIHDAFHLSHKKSFSRLAYLYAKILYYRSILLSDVVVTVSEFSKRELEKHIGIEREIKVIYNGVDYDLFHNQDNEVVKAVKHKYPDKYLLCVGNIKPHKNLRVVIDAFLKLKNPNLSLVIVGKNDGFISQDNDVQKRCSNIGNILFTGFVEDKELIGLYQQAQAFVFPSLYEGFGLPPLEALCSGTRVLVSNQEAMKEVCIDKVEYFDALSSDELCDLISSPRKIVDKQDVEQHLKTFNWEYCRTQHLVLFKSIENR